MNSHKGSVRKVLEAPCLLLYGSEIISDEAEGEAPSSWIQYDFARIISYIKFE